MKHCDEFLSVAALILAAGEASRMGRLKQLLPYGGGTLLWHAIDTAQDAALGPVVVVVGAEAEAVRAATSHKDVTLVENADWTSGMGSSIAAGARAIRELAEPVDAFAILLADQPKVTARHLSLMRSLLLEKLVTQVIAAEYGGTLGVPAFFRSELIGRLINLPAQAGAKAVLLDPELRVERFPLPEAAIDIDTPGDFEALSKENPSHFD